MLFVITFKFTFCFVLFGRGTFLFNNDKSNNFGGGDNRGDNEVKMVLSIRIGCKSDLGFQLVK